MYLPLQYRSQLLSVSNLNSNPATNPKSLLKARYSCAYLEQEKSQIRKNDILKRPSSRSLANVDDLVKFMASGKSVGLKEKNTNAINILNSDINNNETSRVVEEDASLIQPNNSSVKYLKTIINKHKGSVSDSGHIYLNESATRLALAGVAATKIIAEATAASSTRNSLLPKKRLSRVLLFPQIINEKEKELNEIELKSKCPLSGSSVFFSPQKSTNETNQQRPKTARLLKKHSSASALFKLNNLRAHFHSKEQH